MKLAAKSRFVQWSYLFAADYEIPDRTTVCALFWRAFLLSPLKVAFAIAMLAIFWPCLLWAWAKEKGYTAFLERPIRIPLPDLHIGGGDTVRIIKQRINDWKNGVCSLVEIDHSSGDGGSR